MTKYNSGSWTFVAWGETISINSPEYMGIAHINPSGDYDKGIPSSQDVANARLIAYAPDLLEALEALVEQMETQRGDWLNTDHAQTVIAKAKGERGAWSN